MKHILAILLLSTSLAISAEPVVVVQSATVVLVDGVNAGKPADTIRNRPALASAIQRALEKWANDEAAKVTKAQSELAAANSLLQKLRDADTADKLTAVRAEVVTPERERKRAAIREELARRQRELDDLK